MPDRHALHRFASFLTALSRRAERSAWRLIALVLGIIVIIMLLAIWSRYVMQAPFGWTEQLSRMLFVWITFLGAAVLYRRNGHIAIDFFQTLLPPAAARGVRILNQVLMLGLFLVLLIYGARLSWTNLGQTFGALNITPSVYYVSAPVSAALMILFWLEHIVKEALPDRPQGATVDGEAAR